MQKLDPDNSFVAASCKHTARTVRQGLASSTCQAGDMAPQQ